MENETLYPIIKFNAGHNQSISIVLDYLDAYDRKLGNRRLNLRPIFQRGEAWENDFKEKLVYSLITNYPIGNFIFRNIKPQVENDATDEVVDGQQRLLTIRELIRGKMKLSPSISRIIIDENRRYYEFDKKNNLNSSGVKVYEKFLADQNSGIKLSFDLLPSIVQQQILTYNINIIEVECDDRAIAQYFRFIQNQERLRAGEIINSIPDSTLRKYLDKIYNKDLFISNVKWNESRKEFDKLFYNIIGIFDSKLNLGTTDKRVIDYVVSSPDISNDVEVHVSRMIDVINLLTDMNIKNNGRFSKRVLKYLLLLSGYNYVDFSVQTKQKFDILCSIDRKIPVFNSGSQDDIKKMFPNETDDVISNYRKAFILGRGSHSPQTTMRDVKILANLVNDLVRDQC